MPPKQRVVIGLLGSTLDRGRRDKRWLRWRPTVGACWQPELPVARLELLCQPRFEALARDVAADIQEISPDTTVRVHTQEPHDPWDLEAVYGGLHDFVRGYDFDVDAEDYLVHISTGSHVAQICMFLLTESRHIPGRLLQTNPITAEGKRSPQGSARIIDLDLARYDHIAQRFEAERQTATSFLKDGIDTRSPTYNALIDRIELVSLRSGHPLLLEGPTGAGKSRLARRIHALRKARGMVQGRFVEVNCATLRGDAAMAALFGHTRGAFTGAVEARAGLLREADGGVIFLDEIGELGLDEQAMLLHAIEEKRFLPLGSDRAVESDFQLIAGTNRDLRAAVVQGRFRDDLLARIDTWTFALPGLRQRPEDIGPNLDFELDRFASTEARRVTINAPARGRFLAFATGPEGRWPRNFRDLNGAVVRMATLAPAGRITAEVVDEELERLRRAWSAAGPAADDDALLVEVLGHEGAAALDRFDRVQLAEVIAVCRQSPSLAAAGRDLFAVSRTRRKSRNDGDRLRKYLSKWGLDFDAIQSAPLAP